MLDFGYYNMDCIEGMKQFPDKYFDLAVVDPPYGGGAMSLKVEQGSEVGSTDTAKITRTGGRTRKYQMTENIPSVECTRTGGTWAEKYQRNSELTTDITHWDIAPTQEYFDELFRVSKNQIIWGGNYFALPPTRCFLIWRKLTISEKFSMAMAEYAWTSFNDNAKVFEHVPQGNVNESRFHPTQKPIALYEWVLSKYAKEGDTILDTHVGSASSLIACHRTHHKFVGFEIDEYYYQKSKQRLETEQAQMTLYDFME